MICCVILSLFHDVMIGFTMAYHHKYHHVQYLFAVSNSIFQHIPTVSSLSPFPTCFFWVFPHFPIVLTTAFRYLAVLGAWPLLRRLRGLRGLTHGAGGAHGAQDQEDGLGTEAEGRQLPWRSMGKHGKTWENVGKHGQVKDDIRYT